MCKRKKEQEDHPAIFWGVWYLSVISLTMIVSTLLIFICVGNAVEMLNWDLLLSMMLLTGIVMLPTNCYLLDAISRGEKINLYTRVLFCDLWVCMVTIIILSLTSASLCIHQICHCKNNIKQAISMAMKNYRTNPKYKYLMDILQWGLKCCGHESYADWFNQDWYDNIRDYEWDFSDKKLRPKSAEFVTDSVPLSCCKSGSCISNYLMEMGTSSINVNGCNQLLYNVAIVALATELAMFSSVFVVEVIVIWLALSDGDDTKEDTKKNKTRVYDVKHLLNINPNFNSSASLDSASESSAAEHPGSVKKARQEEIHIESSTELP